MYTHEHFVDRDKRTQRREELKRLGYRDVVQYTEPCPDPNGKYFTLYYLAYPQQVIETEKQLAEVIHEEHLA